MKLNRPGARLDFRGDVRSDVSIPGFVLVANVVVSIESDISIKSPEDNHIYKTRTALLGVL